MEGDSKDVNGLHMRLVDITCLIPRSKGRIQDQHCFNMVMPFTIDSMLYTQERRAVRWQRPEGLWLRDANSWKWLPGRRGPSSSKIFCAEVGGPVGGYGMGRRIMQEMDSRKLHV